MPSSFWNSGLCMTAASCFDTAASIASMRVAIVRVTFLLNVTVPLSASSVSVRISSSARDRSVCLVAAIAASSRLPCCVGRCRPRRRLVLVSRRSSLMLLRIQDLSLDAGSAPPPMPSSADSRFSSSVFCRTRSSTALEVVGAVDLGQQVAELVARLQQLSQRLDLLGDVRRLEVVHRVELELDGHLAAVALERVLDRRFSPGVMLPHHVVEVVAVDLDELAVLERLERLGRVAGEVAHHADDERQLLARPSRLRFPPRR